MRLFTHKQKQILFTKASGMCQICGIKLLKGWHADHIIPFSKGGQTRITNGQALCVSCNQKKNNKMNIQLRKWQREFFMEPYEAYANGKKSYLLHAGVGSGKTIAAIHAAKQFLQKGFKVVIFSPSDAIKRNWADQFNNHGNIQIYDNNYNFTFDFRGQYSGLSITYHVLKTPENVEFLINNRIINDKTLIICDEVHHLGDTMSWGESMKELGNRAGFILLLTGTPERSDNNPIPFCRYEEMPGADTFRLHVDKSYSYADSVSDEICCPVSFKRIDIKDDQVRSGQIEDNILHTKIFNDALDGRSSFIKATIQTATNKLMEIRDVMPNAGGLIVCNTVKDAEFIGEYLQDCVVVHSKESDSNDIKAFSESSKKWIVAVKMVSEGVDIPRLRVCVYLSNCTTRLFFEQVVGRIVRNRNDMDLGGLDMAYFYFPNHFELDRHAKNIESELRHIIESQENDFGTKEKKYNERVIQGEIFVKDVEAGSETLINKGCELSEFEIYINAMPDVIMQNGLIRALGIHKHNQIQNEPQIRLVDQVSEIKKKIHKDIGYISIKQNMPHSELHYKYNLISNIYTNEDKENIAKLNYKLNIVKNERRNIEQSQN